MPTSYTSLLGFALPVTGELSGTWGDTVNDYITKYVDAAVAGAQTISGSQTAVTLSTTNGTALSQAGSGSTGSAQYQIINCTGNPASALTVTVPSTSKVYLVLNNTSTNRTVTVKGAATTGVTVAAARAALIAWNGTDFELVATDDASKLNGILGTANGGTGLSSFTANGVVYASSTSALTTGSALTFDGTTVTSTGGSLYLNGTNSDTAMTGSYVRFGTNIGLQSNAANSALVAKMFNGSTFVDALTLNTSGNLGLGVTPSAWSSSVAAQVGYGAALSSRSAGNTASDMTHGAYWNGTNWLYQYSSVGAARYQMTGANAGSTHAWFVSGGGTAGNAISFTQALQITAAGFTQPTAYADTVSALGNTGTATTINLQNANVFTATLTGNCTFTLSNAIATGSSSFTLILTNDGTAGRTVAWSGGSFVFPGGAASLSRTTTANAVDVWVFFTPNGGTTWYGNIAMKDMKA